ncbi:hypothetical protein SASPL_104559 [Salvia splendens]|uniref:Uncharacterized protein n=1 Tax=Salvia splendens TaxID=180675 RepID=A0A8X8YNU0_SALSN|nr:hypothetical protein SASPL_104559 [Salvia splendens]
MDRSICIFLIPVSLLLARLVQNTHAVQYVVTNTVPNTPGGRLFDQEIGVNFALTIMPVINEFIYKVFEETRSEQRTYVPVVNVYISEFPGGLTEGTADYVMVKSGIYDQATYTKPGAGKRWDEGYGTEKFLEYCDSLLKDFTAKLNLKMQYTYSNKYWVELLGKPVDQLWREYKAKYGNQPQEASVDMFQGLKY